jgi:hypothetical protein
MKIDQQRSSISLMEIAGSAKDLYGKTDAEIEAYSKNERQTWERPNLAEMLARVTPENLPDASEFETVPRGKEIW